MKYSSLLLLLITTLSFAGPKYTFNAEIVDALSDYFKESCDATIVETSGTGESKKLVFNNDDMWLLLAYIDNDSSRFIYGDLDGNGKEDLLLMVATNGGCGGSNAANIELLVFLNYESQGYTIHTGITAFQLNVCSNGGYVTPQRIEKRKIICETSCYQEGDSRWEYSDNYLTTVKLIGKEFVVESSISVP